MKYVLRILPAAAIALAGLIYLCSGDESATDASGLRKHADPRWDLADRAELAWLQGNIDRETFLPVAELYRSEAEAGNPEAQFRLALCYRDGKGLPADRSQAFVWFGKVLANQPEPQKILDVFDNLYWHFELDLPPTGLEALAVEKLSALAQKGNVPAATRYAALQAAGKAGVPADPQAALQTVRKHAEAGEPFAQYLLGKFYWEGKLLEQDFGKAIDLLAQAAASGVPAAEEMLGRMYNKGEGIEPQPEKGAALLQRAAAAGSPSAAFLLASYYQNAREGREFAREREKLLRQAYEQGYLPAYANYGLYLNTGDESCKGIQVFLDGVARNDLNCLAELGYCYVGGYGIDPDAEEGLRCLNKAAGEGNPLAMRYLGELYLDGSGVPKDTGRSLSWYQKAAALHDGVALSQMGFLYTNGIGVPKDWARAVTYYEQAAEQQMSSAGRNLYVAYRFGPKEVRNYPKAYETALRGVGQNSPHMMLAAYVLLREGVGCQKDPDAAREMLLRAAKAGSAEAMAELSGLSIPPEGNDPAAAFRWARQAVEADPESGNALFSLSRVYATGIGCQPDPQQARSLLEKAVKKKSGKALQQAALEAENAGDLEKAIQLFQTAAENRDEKAMLHLIRIYTQKMNDPAKLEYWKKQHADLFGDS